MPDPDQSPLPGSSSWKIHLGRGLPALLALLLLQGLLLGQGHANYPPTDVEPARVLVVHAYSQDDPWTKRQHEGFVTGLRGALPVPPIVRTEYLDAERLGRVSGYTTWFADYLGQKYQDFQPQILYVTDDEGLSLGLEVQARSFPRTPLVFSGVEDDQLQGDLKPDLQTGVFEKRAIGPNLDLLQGFAEAGEDIVMVSDGSLASRALLQEIEAELAQRPAMKVHTIAGASLEALLARLSETPGPLLLTSLRRVKDPNGRVLDPEQVIPLIVAGRDAVLTMEDAYWFDGVLGGYLTSGLAQGRSAARLAAAYLAGRPLKDLPPVRDSPNEYLFDDARLAALDLELPEDIAHEARLINPRMGLVVRYQEVFLATFFLLAFFLVMFLLYVLYLAHRKRLLEHQNRHLRHQERVLHKSEELYRRFFELSPDPLLLIHDRHFVMANDATARLLGYADASEVLRTHPSRLSPPVQPDGQSSYDKAEAIFDAAETSGFLRFEWIHLRMDGSPLTIVVSLTRIPQPEGGVDFLCVWHDITGWRRAESGSAPLLQ
jgi:PAS domain S-box-containing protein